MKKQLCNDQITRIIERENVITFKRKNQPKSSLKSQKEEEEEEIKSNPNEDSSFQKLKRKEPLPEINRERKRLALRPSDGKPSNIPAYGEKEVRQRDNLMLKNANNHLSNENIKLKTKNMNLEKEVMRLQKIIEEDPQKSWGVPREGRHPESGSLKIVMKNLKKELEQLKKQNAKIKTSIKFTTIGELEAERDAILEETQRLREMLEEEKNRCNYLKMSQQSASQQQLKQLQDRNFALARENNDLKNRVSKGGEERVSVKHQEIEKNISRQLLNARNTIKQKDKELDYLKQQIKKLSTHQQSSLKVIETHALQNSRSRQIKSEALTKAEPKIPLKAKEKRLMSKSAQKYRTQAVNIDKSEECEACRQLKVVNAELAKKIDEMKGEIDKMRSVGRSLADDFSKNPIKLPTQAEVLQVKKFLIHRFKAHHLTLEEATMHLLNIEDPKQLETQVSISELLEISMTEPFSILSDRYIETFICELCYKGSTGEAIKIEDTRTFKKKALKENFTKLIGQYELISQAREDEMFIQIAELVTNYQQHIHKALSERRNSENTVSEKDFYDFFKEIELEMEYIDFIVSQIILESLDLQHLNIYNLFEIFYMSQEEEQVPQGFPARPPPKNKYKMIETVVKEVDEEYEQSKSFLEGKQKTQSRHQSQPKQIGEEQYEEEYQEQFEEQKKEANKDEEQQERLPEKKEAQHEHFQIENAQDEYIEDYES